MQQAPVSSYASHGVYPAIGQPGLKKHKLQDEQDDTPAAGPSNSGLLYPQTTNRGAVKFSDDNLQSIHAAVIATKRRKGNTGKVTLPIDLEPSFGGLSLEGGDGSLSLKKSSHLNQTIQNGRKAPAVEQPAVLPRFPSPARTQRTHHSGSSSNDAAGPRGRRGERDVTPFPFDASANSPHRKRSSSRNRARLGLRAPSPDEEMQPAVPKRYDPSRPHVIYIDSLSDSEEEENRGSSSFNSDDDDNTFAEGGSSVSTPSNSPSSSDVEDAVISPNRSRRPIQLNKRLRDHLRKQAMLQRLGQKPVIDEALAGAPAITGGMGVQERGLVLYRPLSWGIVEEPDEGETSDSQEASALKISDINSVKIQELPAEDPAFVEEHLMPADDLPAYARQALYEDGDEEMDVDG